ncbi:protein of unknown function [Methylorubrum extorquens]|uniref:Uncharacterized protein n=1 Tax=Methylorubrum extorquens TaxID=408 RepID=A0A2N9AN20_METEX|nr:protein of unknown function [Methylorubrum extorquens]
MDVRPSGGAEIAARRRVRTQGAEGFPPLSGLGREQIGRKFGKEHHGCRLMAGPTA